MQILMIFSGHTLTDGTRRALPDSSKTRWRFVTSHFVALKFWRIFIDYASYLHPSSNVVFVPLIYVILDPAHESVNGIKY